MVLIAQGREMIRKNARRVLYFLCLVFLLTACSAVSNPETDALQVGKPCRFSLEDLGNPELYEHFSFTIDENYFYYMGNFKGGNDASGVSYTVYRRPLAVLTKQSQSEKLTEATVDYVPGALYAERGKIYLYYYTGGATMGSGHLYEIKESGQVREIGHGKFSYFDFDEFQIKTPELVPPEPFKMTYEDQNGARRLGEEGYCYRASYLGVGRGYADVWEQRLYCLAYQEVAGISYDCHICEVDLQTGATTPISRPTATNFKIVDGIAYYSCYDKPAGTRDTRPHLYALDLSNKQEHYLGAVGMAEQTVVYAATKNGVYYRDADSGHLIFANRYTEEKEILNASQKVKGLTDCSGYIVAYFEETPENPYRLMVFAPSGQTMKQMYATADCSDKAVINADGLLVYRLEGNNQLVQVQL